MTRIYNFGRYNVSVLQLNNVKMYEYFLEQWYVALYIFKVRVK